MQDSFYRVTFSACTDPRLDMLSTGSSGFIGLV